MADKKISQLNSLTKATIASNDVIPVVDTSALETKKITFTELMNPLDSVFKISGSSDNTKQARFEVDGLTTGTVRTLTIPDSDFVIVGVDIAQTLTQKTLTSPQMNFGGDLRGDLITRNAAGTTVTLHIGATGTIPSVNASGDLEFIANPAAANGSTTVKGVYEEATQAEVDAGTVSGSTGADLTINPSTLRAKLLNSGVADTGSSTAYAIAPSPVISSYATYQEFTFLVANTNTTTNPTLNVNGVGAKTIVDSDGTGLKIGQLKAGSIYTVIYNGTNMQLKSASNILRFLGSGTKDTTDASTTQTFAHGLGKIPKIVNIIGMGQLGVQESGGHQAYSGAIAEAIYDGTTQISVSIISTWNGSIYTGVVTSAFVLSANAVGAGSDGYRQTGVITVDATNITITWTRSGSVGAGSYNLICKAEA